MVGHIARPLMKLQWHQRTRGGDFWGKSFYLDFTQVRLLLIGCTCPLSRVCCSVGKAPATWSHAICSVPGLTAATAPPTPRCCLSNEDCFGIPGSARQMASLPGEAQRRRCLQNCQSKSKGNGQSVQDRWWWRQIDWSDWPVTFFNVFFLADFFETED